MMSAGGATVTCLPVQIDPDLSDVTDAPSVTAPQTPSISSDKWQSAVFFRLGGSESKKDIQILSSQQGPFSLGLETDIIEHESASVVMLRVQVFAQQDNPLVGEVLLTPGGAETHYEILSLLSGQEQLYWFFSDARYRVIYQQSQPLAQPWRDEFKALRDEAFKRDALIRLTGKYNAHAAFAEVISRYSLR